MSVGENVKNQRLALNMTQTELAKKVGVNQSMIAQIERGTKGLSIPLGKAIADVFGVPLEKLVQ